MTLFLLIRHAAHDWLGRELVGRKDGVPINAEGAIQSAQLATLLQGLPIRALYSSPMQRAQETARPIAEALGSAMLTEPAFDEIDFGDWTGRTFAELDSEPAWQQWNERRGIAQVPGGEKMLDVQQRALAGVQHLCTEHAHSCVAIVSHGDVIKAMLAAARGMSLDELQAIDVEPASVSILKVAAGTLEVLLENDPGTGVSAVLTSFSSALD